MRQSRFERKHRLAGDALARMQSQLKSGNAFIAVGALHLYGERGLLALLQQRGYRVTRVY